MASEQVSGSPAGSITGYDLKRAALHALEGGAATALTLLGEWASGADLGPSKVLVIAGLTWIAGVVQRFFSNTQRKLVA